MPAPIKLTGRLERRLLAIIELGEPVTVACRAVGVSRETVRRHALTDPAFAARLAAARRHEPAGDDWLAAAAWLETEAPDRWLLPLDPGGHQLHEG